MKTKVVHCKKAKFDVYIGRPSKWGNPFKLRPGDSREKCLDDYRTWLMNQPELLSALGELKGQILGCWCKPQSCHGDILAELADGIRTKKSRSISSDTRVRQS
jgi:hypothetical protein